MEYKKNRQNVIKATLEELKGINKPAITPPAFLSHTQAAASLERLSGNVKAQINRLKRTADAVLTNPSKNDPIFKVCQRLFKNNSDINLKSGNQLVEEIRELAERRFLRGLPPRKNTDNSIGDAFNWEWIINCAQRKNCDVVIASRDSDYGFEFGNKLTISEWLAQEFKERVGGKRIVTLTNSLTNGLKLAKITVTKTEQKAENAFLAFDATAVAAGARAALATSWPGIAQSFEQIGRETSGSQKEAILAVISKMYAEQPRLIDFLNKPPNK